MSTENKESEVRTYAILQETSGEESESWLYFIKYQGNEEALAHLEKQLDMVDWYIYDDLSTFDLETKFLVSETTAKEMTKIDLNCYSFHRKFDGKLKNIDLGLKDNQNNVKKMKKVFKVLGYGKIEEFIDQEDVDPEDLVSVSEEEDDESSNSESDSSSSSSVSEEDEKELNKKKSGKLPGSSSKSKFDIPRVAKIKQAKKNKK